MSKKWMESTKWSSNKSNFQASIIFFFSITNTAKIPKKWMYLLNLKNKIFIRLRQKSLSYVLYWIIRNKKNKRKEKENCTSQSITMNFKNKETKNRRWIWNYCYEISPEKKK